MTLKTRNLWTQLLLWSWELGALGASILSLLAMAVLLACFDGKRIFDWHGVTLNALISILSVTMKAFLIFVVTQCIGQWKWILFSCNTRPRPLLEFENIDLASRGPLGSVTVLWTVRGSWPLKLGALIIIMTLALDPFSQQLVQLSERTRFIEASVGAPQAESYHIEGYRQGELKTRQTHSYEKYGNVEKNTTTFTANATVHIQMEAAIVNGMTLPLWRVNQLQDVQCPAESCRWPKFDTFGVCHRCANVTSKLRNVGNFSEVVRALAGISPTSGVGMPMGRPKFDSSAFVLPNGHFLAAPDGCTTSALFDLNGEGSYDRCQFPDNNPPSNGSYSLRMTTFGTGNPNKTTTMQDIDTLIWSTSVIHPDMSRPDDEWSTNVLAEECALYYCVKTIDASIDKNNLTETAVEAIDAKVRPDSWSLLGQPKNNHSAHDHGVLEFDYLDSYNRRDHLVLYFPNNATKPEYRINDDAVWALSSHFQQLFKEDSIRREEWVGDAIDDRLGPDAVGFNGYLEGTGNTPLNIGNLWYYPHPGIREAGGREQRSLHVAFAALATTMTNAIRQSEGNMVVPGLLSETKTYYSVMWAWIALHGMMLLGAVVTWVLTFIRSVAGMEVVPAWKSSVLPVISQAQGVSEILKGAETVKQMEKRARAETVVIPLDSNGNGEDIPLRRRGDVPRTMGE